MMYFIIKVCYVFQSIPVLLICAAHREAGNNLQSPKDFGHKAGYTLDRLLIHHRATLTL